MAGVRVIVIGIGGGVIALLHFLIREIQRALSFFFFLSLLIDDLCFV